MNVVSFLQSVENNAWPLQPLSNRKIYLHIMNNPSIQDRNYGSKMLEMTPLSLSQVLGGWEHCLEGDKSRYT